jgi:hypothetical protein
MQIFELTQSVNEINWGDATKAIGNKILQAPVRALGQRVGQDLIPPDDDKTIGQQAADAERFFDAALDMLEHNYDYSTVIARLTNKYGATKQQAMTAVDNALSNIEQSMDKNQSQRQPPAAAPTQTPIATQQPADPFNTMAHQLGRKQANPARTNTTVSAAPAAPSVPQTPEQIRQAKQRAAAARADAEAQPVPAAAPGTPLSQMSPEQQRIMKQKFAGSMARAQMSATPATAATPATPTNYGTGVGPAVKPQISVAPSSVAGSSAVSPQSQTPPNYGSGVGPGVKPQMTAAPTINPPVAKPSAPSNVVPIRPGAAPVKQEPISIGGQKIKPGDPLYDKLQKQIAQQQPAAVTESLTWSRGFDPSATLLKKIKQP